MNKLILPVGAAVTMSSREIAELTGKRHDNVMTLCRSMRDMGVCPEIQETPYLNEQNGQTYFECQLTKRDSLVLIARISPEFTARVVDRWQELEAKQAPAIPQTYAEALRLAADQAEQLALAAPKVAFVDRYVSAESGSMGFRQVAKLLKIKEHDFRTFLVDEKIMYQLSGEWTAYQNHIDAGRFEVRTGVADNEHAYTSARFTPKGVEWVAGEWAKKKVRNEL